MTTITAELKYLCRDELFTKEKPYAFQFLIEEREGQKRTNYELEKHTITMHSIDEQDSFDLDQQGFCVLTANTTPTVDDLLSQSASSEAAYIEELKELLHQRFPIYTRLEVVDFTIRSRHPDYPADKIVQVKHQQPAPLAHSDYSIQGALMQLHASFPNQKEHINNATFDMLNVWRPLVGPNDDWPLALCDYMTIDKERDTVSADLIYNDRVGENQLLYHHSAHRWYYMPQQRTEDMFVFRNTDSSGERACAFHCAFFNTASKSPPRQSCEVRFVAFR